MSNFCFCLRIIFIVATAFYVVVKTTCLTTIYLLTIILLADLLLSGVRKEAGVVLVS